MSPTNPDLCWQDLDEYAPEPEVHQYLKDRYVMLLPRQVLCLFWKSDTKLVIVCLACRLMRFDVPGEKRCYTALAITRI